MDINTVKDGAGYPLLTLGNDSSGTRTGLICMIVISAGIRIHGGDQLKYCDRQSMKYWRVGYTTAECSLMTFIQGCTQELLCH